MKIIQVLDALDYGDGVSNDVINKKNMLQKMHYETAIYSRWVHEKVLEHRKDISQMSTEADDIIIHHFSGKSTIVQDVLKQKGTKIFFYHNITPAEFWDNQKDTLEGIEQVKTYGKQYNYLAGDSHFNINDLRKFGLTQQADVLPVFINFKEAPKDNFSFEQSTTKFLFVGRVAPNKKHEDIIRTFDYYYRNINSNSHLTFVGNYEAYPEYYKMLQQKIRETACSSHIVFTGKTSDEALHQYYKEASVFLCMSEHEGFCIPLLESMHHGIPTFACAAGAVEETMGQAGILFYDKSPKLVAELIHIVLSNRLLYQSIVEKQKKRLEYFSEKSLQLQFEALIQKWRH